MAEVHVGWWVRISDRCIGLGHVGWWMRLLIDALVVDEVLVHACMCVSLLIYLNILILILFLIYILYLIFFIYILTSVRFVS